MRITIIFVFLSASISLLGQKIAREDSLKGYLSEIKTNTLLQRKLWGIDLIAPILFVDPQSRVTYASEQDSLNILQEQDGLYIGALPENINVANTALKWSGKYWAMIMLPLSRLKAERLNLLSHELFHRAQPALGFNITNIDNNHLDMKEGRIYLRLELEALKKSVHAKSKDEIRHHVSNALKFRRKRNRVFKGSAETENLLELNEGLAEFTGLIMSGRKRDEVEVHINTDLTEFLRNKTFVRSFAYHTVPIYGYLLTDKFDPFWNRKIDVHTNLTGFFQKAFGVDSAGFHEDISYFKEYNVEQILKEEEQREQANQKLVHDLVDKFVTGPHFEIALEAMNVSFDPREIIALDEYGTVYPSIIVNDKWGMLTVSDGALMSPAWNKITVARPTKVSEKRIEGEGWKLEINSDNYFVTKDQSGNYYLQRKQ